MLKGIWHWSLSFITCSEETSTGPNRSLPCLEEPATSPYPYLVSTSPPLVPIFHYIFRSIRPLSLSFITMFRKIRHWPLYFTVILKGSATDLYPSLSYLVKSATGPFHYIFRKNRHWSHLSLPLLSRIRHWSLFFAIFTRTRH